MHVLMTGATGFTGGYVLRRLREYGHDVRCFVRSTSDLTVLPPGTRTEVGDLGDADSLCRALEGSDALVNVASLGFGHGPGIVAAAVRAGVPRAVFFSTTAVFTTLAAKSKAVRVAAEEAICSSILEYTVLRPTMIYGARRDRNMAHLISFVRRFPVLPILGDGESLQQPVYVKDLADAVVACLSTGRTARRTYNVSGAAPLTYNSVVDTVAAALDRRVAKAHLPLSVARVVVAVQQRVLPRPLLRVEQVLRLNEDKVFSHEDATRDFGYRPLAFEEGIGYEITEMGYA